MYKRQRHDGDEGRRRVLREERRRNRRSEVVLHGLPLSAAPEGLSLIHILLILPFGIANIFVTIRRLHDMGYSGYWYFALLAAGMFASALDKVVPVASLIVTVIVYVCLSQKSQPGLNKYDVSE